MVQADAFSSFPVRRFASGSTVHVAVIGSVQVGLSLGKKLLSLCPFGIQQPWNGWEVVH